MADLLVELIKLDSIESMSNNPVVCRVRSANDVMSFGTCHDMNSMLVAEIVGIEYCTFIPDKSIALVNLRDRLRNNIFCVISGIKDEINRIACKIFDCMSSNSSPHLTVMGTTCHALSESIQSDSSYTRRDLVISSCGECDVICVKSGLKRKYESDAPLIERIIFLNGSSQSFSSTILESNLHEMLSIRQLLHLNFKKELRVTRCVGVVVHISSVHDENSKSAMSESYSMWSRCGHSYCFDNQLMSETTGESSKDSYQCANGSINYAVSIRDVNYPDLITLFIEKAHFRNCFFVGSVIFVDHIQLLKTSSLRHVYAKLLSSRSSIVPVIG